MLQGPLQTECQWLQNQSGTFPSQPGCRRTEQPVEGSWVLISPVELNRLCGFAESPSMENTDPARPWEYSLFREPDSLKLPEAFLKNPNNTYRTALYSQRAPDASPLPLSLSPVSLLPLSGPPPTLTPRACLSARTVEAGQCSVRFGMPARSRTLHGLDQVNFLNELLSF